MNPILLTVWAVLVAGFLGLLAYRGQLTRYEDEQLFLSDEVTPEQRQRNELVLRLKKLQPIVRLAGGAAGLVTICAVAIYVWQAWESLPG